MLEASMLVIGDELLSGFVDDANTPWLARRLHDNGVPLTHVHTIGDEFDAINEALQVELGRSRPRLIVTSGGIGSTPDDITFEAIARSVGRAVVETPALARRMEGIIARSREHGLDVDEVFVECVMRMARVPEGSRVLTDDAQWIPAIAVDIDGGCDADGATIVVLPGVPAAFRRVVEEVVEPAFIRGRNPVPVVEEITHALPESVLNPLFHRLLTRYPTVKLGSYPGRPMMIRLTGSDQQVSAAAEFVRQGLAELIDSPAGARMAAAWASRSAAHDDEDAT